MARSDGSDLDPDKRTSLLALQWELREAYPHFLPAGTLLFRCRGCGNVYPLNHFSRNHERRYGIRSDCRHCRRAERPTERFEPNPEVTDKRCTRCYQRKPVANFYINRIQPDGYHPVCRECSYANRDQWADERTREEALRERHEQTLRLCGELGIDYPGYDILQCRRCGEVKHTNEFINDWRYASRKKPVCLGCHTFLENG